MTGLYNHSSCYELLELEFRSHRRYGAGIALILMDIHDGTSQKFGYLLSLWGRGVCRDSPIYQQPC